MSPLARVSGSAASSTPTMKPSGRTTLGPAEGAAEPGVAGGVAPQAAMVRHVTISRTSRRNLFIAFPFLVVLLIALLVAGNEVVLFRIVAEGAERHPEQFRGLGLHPFRALEGFEHEILAYVL